MFLIFMVTVGITSLIFALINWIIRRRNRKPEIEPFAPLCSLPSFELPKPIKPARTETIDGVDYVFREHWWFQRFPINDEIALELLVGYGADWIWTIKPKPDIEITQDIAKIEVDGNRFPFGSTGYAYSSGNRYNYLQQQCNVQESHDIQLATAQCCCTTQRIDEMRARLDIMNTQCGIDDLERQLQMQRQCAVPYLIPVAPPYYPVGYGMSCGYGGGGYGSF